MPDESEGLRIARERIAKEREERTGFLDLGKLGLRNWPEELWELRHLNGLNLGNRWIDNEKWRKAESDFTTNQLNPQEAQWSSFPNLKHLHIRGIAWRDLSLLTKLKFLQSLDCSNNRLTSLEPVVEFLFLQSLVCSGNQLSTLEPLSALTSLRSLVCWSNELTTLEPLTKLFSLQSLDCSSNELTTLEPLAGLTSLRSLVCWSNQLSTLEPLAGLSSLQALVCSSNELTTLEPLAGLTSLRSLVCWSNQLSTLEPLAGLSSLQALDCSGNELTTLEPLTGLTSLRSLVCWGNQLTTLEPLAKLSSLQSLDCRSNQLTTLEPLAGLTSLQSLDCWGNPLESLPEKLLWHESLQTLILPSNAFEGIPAEALSQHDHDNCLARLRAHFRDLGKGGVLLPDVKVMVLGNGRTGKTQLCNRLRGLPFEENADSTHGITVASQQFGPDTLLRLWDFGGQDIYHGTHALFMRGHAVLVLVWTPDSENSATHTYNGMIFRNHPLAWWQSFMRHAVGLKSPVLVVQNRCDRPEDKRLRLPVALEELEAFPFCQVLQYSALNQRGKAALEEALKDAVGWLRKRHGQVKIGIGRLAVKERLEALLTEDAVIADLSQRQHRTLTVERYEQICAECGGVSSAALLLEYLHLSGVVLHRPGLFGDRIILDQRWALEAVYSVFNRDRSLIPLRQLHGRMTRTLLEALVWQDCTKDEQELLLGLMLSCGICFIHREGNEALGLETKYIAPDLLPDHTAVAHELAARWEDELPFDEAAVELPFPHPGVMRALLSRIGNLAGMAPVYWRDGVCLHESTHRSHARIEQWLEDKPPRIVVRTRKGESLSLLKELVQWVREAAEHSGLKEVRVRLPESANPNSRASGEFAFPDRQSSPSLIFEAMPNSGTITYAVSYAWKDQSKETVERLCREAESQGIRIMRDVTDAGLGEKLSRFMTSLAGRDRVFVILSDAYLHSENCMFELSEIWRLSRQDDAQFHERVRVFRLPDAPIYDMGYQLDIIDYWEQEYQKVHARVTALTGRGTLSEMMLRRFNNLKAFAQHAGEIVPGIADRLLPKDFEEFVRHGLTDNSSTPSPAPNGTESRTALQVIKPPPPIPMSQKQKILFLAANPANETRLALDVECREIEARIRAAEHRDLVEMHTKFAVRPADLLQYLQQHTPHIVHFSGHGGGAEEIILLGPDGKAKPVAASAITQLFRTFQDNIRVVVFNACFSRAQAEAVTSVIDCAVGMKQAIGDEAAISFAAAFYQSIAFGRSVRTAFEAGKTAIMLEGIPEEDTPVLLTRASVDANQIILARPNP